MHNRNLLHHDLIEKLDNYAENNINFLNFEMMVECVYIYAKHNF
jgi:hypothetical protein